MPKISIIVPVYKVEPYIHRCIDSILRQTYEDFELILVDDGSPDNCGAICDAYAMKDHRVRVIHQENAGVSVARNVGIEWALTQSDSKWIAFVDSDDWIHRDYLKILVTGAEKFDAQISACGLLWTKDVCEDTEASNEDAMVLSAEQTFVEHYPKCTPPYCKLIDKVLLKDLRFPVGIRYEDAYITHILVLSANRIAVTNQKLYYYFWNDSSFTKSMWTENRLEGIKVHEARMAYLLEHGYEKCYQKEVTEYAKQLTVNLKELMHLVCSDENYDRNFNYLREKLRVAFQMARDLGLLPFSKETMWTYFFVSKTDVFWKMAKTAQMIYHKLKK